MDTEQTEANERRSSRRFLYGLGAVLGGCAALLEIVLQPGFFMGWFLLFSALLWGCRAFTYQPSVEIIYRAPKWWVAFVIAVCVVPPVVLLFYAVIGEHKEWMGLLLGYFFLSSSIGPMLMFRRYRVPPSETVSSKAQ